LIAPVSHHRQVFHRGMKPQLVRRSDQLARAGLFALVIAMSGAVFLVLDVAADLAVACALAGVVLCVYIVLWYVLPRLLP
jgi:hypothetical protein